MLPIRAIYYVNQFFAGIGGEDKAISLWVFLRTVRAR